MHDSCAKNYNKVIILDSLIQLFIGKEFYVFEDSILTINFITHSNLRGIAIRTNEIISLGVHWETFSRFSLILRLVLLFLLSCV